MEKFTFIFEYQKGTYIKQNYSSTLEEAIYKWGDEIGPEITGFRIEEKNQLLSEIKTDRPTPLAGLENVWCISLKIGRHLHLLNIVKTV